MSWNAGLAVASAPHSLEDLARELAAAESYTVNTSNAGKLAEFQHFLGKSVTTTQHDLQEPATDATTIIVYKASQFDDVIVDDTSLEVEGEDVGVNVRWLLQDLPRYAGKKAIFRCMLGIKHHGKVLVYKGEVPGTLVAPRGQSFGFNPVFLPDGASKTLGEEIPTQYNARYLAIQKILAGTPDEIFEPRLTWEGPFQH